MQLPRELREAIEREAAGYPGLRAAARRLSEAYRAGRPPRLDSDEDCAAYAATRLPATFAAAARVLREVPGEIASVLDLGAGAGAASWAARLRFPAASLTLVEQSASLLEWSRRLGPPEWSRVRADLSTFALPPADLVMLSYSLGELRDPLAVMERAWQAARRALVVIEPGTKVGFALVERMRSHWLPYVASPCRHRGACPMAAAGDWCHFAARLERSALHRRLKEGELSYEDEKFSYLVLVKEPAALNGARVVRHPVSRPGMVELTLCEEAGLRQAKVTKRDGDLWRWARKAEWGDGLA